MLQEKMLRCFLAICLLTVFFGGTGAYWDYVCERSGSMTLNCGPWGYIYITSASYGRSRSDRCGGGGNTNCHASRSMSVVEHSCEGQRRCTLYASNSAFGDPCVGTVKYLEVTYKCVSSSSRGKLKRICEFNSGSIRCPSGWTINILSANYGRMTGGHICSGSVRTTHCRASGSLSTVRSRCQGRSYCYLYASNSYFGDPCQGTTKYLEVRYECQ